MARGAILPKTPPTYDTRCGTYAGVRAHQKRGEDQCSDCKVARREYHNAKQRERRADKERRDHDNAVSRPLDLARYHANRAADPEAVRERERRSYRTQMDRPGSPRRKRVESHHRRYLEGGVNGVPSTGTLTEKLAYYDGRCWLCGTDTAEAGLHWDHVKPLSAGGVDVLCNLRPTCPPCNLSKGHTWPVDTRIRR